jgi:hypothetical protein
LARIQVDIDNRSDHTWQLDIKKASVHPSAAARHFLSKMVDYVAEESIRRFRPVVSATQIAENVSLWLRIQTHDIVHYKINRLHPIIQACLSIASPDQSQRIEAVIDALELSLPIRQLYFDQAANHNVAHDDRQLEARIRQIFDTVLSGLTKDEADAFIVDLPFLEPFRSHPTITKRLLEGRHC